MSQKFSKSERILKSRDFRNILENGRKTVSRHVVLFTKDAATDNSRLGLVVSKRVGNAVARNAVKRCIREWFRTRPQPQLDIVVLARHSAANADYQRMCVDLDRCLKRSIGVK